MSPHPLRCQVIRDDTLVFAKWFLATFILWSGNVFILFTKQQTMWQSESQTLDVDLQLLHTFKMSPFKSLQLGSQIKKHFRENFFWSCIMSYIQIIWHNQIISDETLVFKKLFSAKVISKIPDVVDKGDTSVFMGGVGAVCLTSLYTGPWVRLCEFSSRSWFP